MEERVPRQWLRARWVVLTALLAVSIMVLGSASKAQAEWHWWGALKAECRYFAPNGHPLNYAVVSANMIVRNEDYGNGRHFANRMTIKARLVPDTSKGNYFENWTRSWRSASYGPLYENHVYRHRMKVNTGTVNPEYGWKVQYKLIWDRPFPWADIGSTGEISFNACEPSGEGGIVFN